MTRPDSLTLTADRPVWLDSLTGAWSVDSGFVDLFAMRVRDRETRGRREFVLRLQPGETLLGAAGSWPDVGVGLLAVGGLNTELTRLTDFPAGVEHWVLAVDAVMRDPAGVWADRNAAAGQLTVPEGTWLGAEARRLMWATVLDGRVERHGWPGTEQGAPPLPVSAAGPLLVRRPARLLLSATSELAAGELDAALTVQLTALAGHTAALLTAREEDRAARASSSAAASADILAAGIARLAGRVSADDEADLTGEPAWRALSLVARAIGQKLPARPVVIPAGLPAAERFAAYAEEAELRLRPVLLREGWWRRDNGPLLAVRQADGAPVALLRNSGRYVARDATSGDTWRVNAAEADTLAPEAWMLYRSYPFEPVSMGGLLRFTVQGLGAIMPRVAALSLLVALLGLAVPIATGLLVDKVLPASDRGQMLVLIGGLLAAAFGAAMIGLTRGLLLLQLEARIALTTQAALFDRLMRLPVGFFRRFGAGDLSDRVMAVEQIRRTLTSSTLAGALGGLLGLVNGGVMLFYNVRLGLFGIAAAVLSGIVAFGLGRVQVRRERQLADVRGGSESFVLQAIQGVAKLKVAAAVDRAFAIWASAYGRQRQAFMASQRAGNLQQVWPAGFMPLATAALFLLGAWVVKDLATQAATDAAQAVAAGQPPSDPGTFGLGAWLGFTSAFGQLMTGISTAVRAVTGAMAVVPLFERARPILQTPTESARGRKPPGILVGDIEFSGVTFGYVEDAPPVLHGLSFAIHPGEYVAIVGASGSGKSTILRMMLGLESPVTGSVLFDGRPLESLDIAAVRRQIGVVLQNGRVQPGSLLSNIGAGRPISQEDAWVAARLAGLEADIKAMPMGLHTVLTDAGGTLSGGQRQRLMIARALARRPRILLLDEATSALDNRTQAVVTETVAGLGMTRIVVAHRLSTIARVDRVLVMDQGRLAQSGRFDELMNTPGLFQELARRQLS